MGPIDDVNVRLDYFGKMLLFLFKQLCNVNSAQYLLKIYLYFYLNQTWHALSDKNKLMIFFYMQKLLQIYIYNLYIYTNYIYTFIYMYMSRFKNIESENV